MKDHLGNHMDTETIKQLLWQEEDRIKEEAEEVCDTIFNHPELGLSEHFASSYLTGKMEELGFTVTMPYCGFETAFRCELGQEDGPVVAFLAEYDALPGYGPDRNQNGHACGHNWIAASTFAACASLARIKKYWKGKIIYIGTPAEETIGSKITMARMGAFDGIDGAFQIHLSDANCVSCKALAQAEFLFTFEGKAAHASKSPEEGVNALDACQLTFAGINALRQHLTPDVKIHGYIREGGMACNIVPDHCTLPLYVRAGDKAYMETVNEKVVNCAKGAALMTGASLSVHREENTFYDLRNDKALMALMKRELEALGIADFVEGDIYHAASTDVGNVSYSCPTCYCELSTEAAGEAQLHSQEFLQVANSPAVYRLLHIAAKAMAGAALEVLDKNI